MKTFSSALIKQESTTNNLLDAIANNEGILNTATDLILGASKSDELKAFNDIQNQLVEGMNNITLQERITSLQYDNLTRHNWFYKNNFFYKTLSKDLNFDINDQQVFSAGTRETRHIYEDPFRIGANVASVINNYKYMLSYAVPQQLEPVAHDRNSSDPNSYFMTVVQSANAPSLFNPYASINVIGITENIPLIHNSSNENINPNENGDIHYSNLEGQLENETNKEILKPVNLTSGIGSKDQNISDCSITTLVRESNKAGGGCLGLATYRYVDFMYCKDLGKIPNNRLITLRRFPGPVNDNIFKSAHPKAGSDKEKNPARSIQDIGRLLTWFDNDDNKLEDICKYQYHATWKQLESKISQETSQQSDDGLVDKIANFLSPSNNLLVGKGFSGNTGLLGSIMGKFSMFGLDNSKMSRPYYDMSLLKNYDQNKVYTPPNSVWDTHKYEGRLIFNQSINLVFRYTLRSYENINPKTAFLDLIGNILTVTYRKGVFWGGENQVVGPSGNTSVYNKANAWIDKAFDKLGGFWTALSSGDFDIQGVQQWINQAIESIGQAAQQVVESTEEKAKELTGIQDGDSKKTKVQKTANAAVKGAQGVMEKMTEWNKHYHWTDALKGMLKNQLGRPAMYAFNSLLTGEAVGPWHLTIGNPKNPILSIGNLIMENAEVQHLGPLGLDDFPTEIRVTVQLKHAKSRDSIDIQKMYTKGVSSIYQSMKLVKTRNYWYNEKAFGDLKDIFSESPMLLRKGLSEI